MNIEDYREYCLSYNESPKHWIGINPTTAPVADYRGGWIKEPEATDEEAKNEYTLIDR